MKKETTVACTHNVGDEFGKKAEQLWNLEHSDVPRALYHYSSVESMKSIIENGKMWASAFECMNDNMEFRRGMELAIEEVEKSIDRASIVDNFKSEIKKGWRSLLFEETKSPTLRPYVLSFSSSDENEHLWQEYAQKNKGTVIHFDCDPSKLSAVQGRFLKAVYDRKKAMADLANNLEELNKLLPKFSCEICDRTHLKNLLFAYLQTVFKFAVLLKDKKWSPEGEWRLVIFGSYSRSPQSEHGDIKFRTRNGNIVDFLETDLCKSGLKIVGVQAGDDFEKNSLNSMRFFLARNRVPML